MFKYLIKTIFIVKLFCILLSNAALSEIVSEIEVLGNKRVSFNPLRYNKKIISENNKKYHNKEENKQKRKENYVKNKDDPEFKAKKKEDDKKYRESHKEEIKVKKK